MFLELLPDWTHLLIAWMSFIILVGGAAAVIWYWIRKAISYRRSDRSALDE